MHAGEQRSGHRAQLEPAERDLAEQVAEPEHEEERDLRVRTQHVVQPRQGCSPDSATAAAVSKPPPSAR